LRRARRRQARQRRTLLLQAAGASPLTTYWDLRYVAGGSSGAGSTGSVAARKAAYVNDLIRREQVTSVVDWGCGDGQQLDLLDLPATYLGVDISPAAVARCLVRHPGRAFLTWPAADPPVDVRAELALSLDVVFHLVADDDFTAYWGRLFASARRLVLVHSTDVDATSTAAHVRHRRHTHLAPDGWQLVDAAADPAVPGFYLWRRR
jgi:SAM-dependent methyltransferase